MGFYDLLHKSAIEHAYGSMAKQTPYLQRRGDTFSFRIAVPSELQNITGKREYIKSLQTTDKNIAVPMALRLAATAKQLFYGFKGKYVRVRQKQAHGLAKGKETQDAA